MSTCMYSCQGQLECFEAFQEAPMLRSKIGESCSDLDKSKPAAFCEAGLFCTHRDSSPYPTCTTAGVIDDVNVGIDDRACPFSGQGVVNCVLKKGETCGLNVNTRCRDGFFCADDGTCTMTKPVSVSTANCNVYSGVGIRDCQRRVATDNKCGPKNKHRACPANSYCNAGNCVDTPPNVVDDTCVYYSGTNVPCKARTTPVPAPARSPAPAPAPAPVPPPFPNFKRFPNKRWDMANLPKGTVSKLATSDACIETCDKNNVCKAFSYKNPDCTLYLNNFPFIPNSQMNINQYSKTQANTTIGYRG